MKTAPWTVQQAEVAKDITGYLAAAIRELHTLRALEADLTKARALSVAITEAETARLWFRSVLPLE